MAAQVWGNNMPVIPELLRNPIPTAAMIAPTVQKDQRRGIGVSPIDIMQFHTLRDVSV